MEFSVTHQAIDLYSGDCAVVFVFKDQVQQNIDLQDLLTLNNFDSKVANTLALSRVKSYKASRLIVVGVGELPLSGKNYVKSMLSLASALETAKVINVMLPSIDVDGKDELWVQQITARVLQNASYQVDKHGIEKENNNTLASVSVYSALKDNTALNQGLAIANGMALTRELGDMPPNICTPSYLAETAQSLAKNYGLECEILDEDGMEGLGMNSLLSVGKGSSEPSKLISLSYKNAGDDQPIVLDRKSVV